MISKEREGLQTKDTNKRNMGVIPFHLNIAEFIFDNTLTVTCELWYLRRRGGGSFLTLFQCHQVLYAARVQIHPGPVSLPPLLSIPEIFYSPPPVLRNYTLIFIFFCVLTIFTFTMTLVLELTFISSCNRIIVPSVEVSKSSNSILVVGML